MKNRITSAKRLLRGVFFTNLMIVISSGSVLAVDNSWYNNNRELLVTNNIIDDALRKLSWLLTLGVCKISDVCETLYDKTFGIIDITQYGEINNLITRLQPVLIAITTLCLIGLGLSLMINREKRSNLVKNILLSIFAVSCSLYAFTALNNLAYSFKEGVLSENTKINQSYTLVDSNIIDLVRQDTEGNINTLNYKKGVVHKVGSHINDSTSFSNIDYNEKLDFSNPERGKNIYGWSDTFNDLIKYRTVGNGAYAQKIENYSGFFTTTLGNEFYYRYHYDFLTCILQLCALVVVFISLSYKNVRIAYELVVSRLMAFMFAGDISSGEKLKGTLIFIRDTYITLCVSVLCIKLYEVMMAFLTSMGITGIAKGIISLFIAFAVIDGPNLVERLLGMDAGLRSSFARSWAAISAGVATGRALTGGVKNLGAAAATGKTASQRRAARGNGSVSEWAATKAHNKLTGGGSTKSSGDGSEKGTDASTVNVGQVNTNEAAEQVAAMPPQSNSTSKADQQINKMNSATTKKSTRTSLPSKRVSSSSKYVGKTQKKKGDK